MGTVSYSQNLGVITPKLYGLAMAIELAGGPRFRLARHEASIPDLLNEAVNSQISEVKKRYEEIVSSCSREAFEELKEMGHCLQGYVLSPDDSEGKAAGTTTQMYRGSKKLRDTKKVTSGREPMKKPEMVYRGARA